MISSIFRLTRVAAESTTHEIVRETGDMAGLISEYGPVVVVLSIFFILFIVFAVVILRSNAKMKGQIMKNEHSDHEYMQQLIGQFVSSTLTEYQNNNTDKIEDAISSLKDIAQSISSGAKSNNEDVSDHRDLIGKYINVNIILKNATRLALESLKCDRTAIYVFHNGNTSAHGLPFFKMSCIHEWNSHGSNTLRGKYHTDLPLHMFGDFVEDLWEVGYYKTDDVEASVANGDVSIKEFVTYSDTKALYIVAIKGEDGTIAGFVDAEFSNPDSFGTDTERDKFVRNILDDMVNTVTPIVTKAKNMDGRE